MAIIGLLSWFIAVHQYDGVQGLDGLNMTADRTPKDQTHKASAAKAQQAEYAEKVLEALTTSLVNMSAKPPSPQKTPPKNTATVI
jgi:hypothetical protein